MMHKAWNNIEEVLGPATSSLHRPPNLHSVSPEFNTPPPKKAFQNVVCEMATILLRPQCVIRKLVFSPTYQACSRSPSLVTHLVLRSEYSGRTQSMSIVGWWPGSSCRQIISNHGTDSAKLRETGSFGWCRWWNVWCRMVDFISTLLMTSNCWLRTPLRALSDPWIIIFWSRRSVDWSILAKDLLLQLPQCCGMTYLYTSNNPHRWTFLSLVLRHVCSNLLISYDCVNVCMFISCLYHE